MGKIISKKEFSIIDVDGSYDNECEKFSSNESQIVVTNTSNIEDEDFNMTFKLNIDKDKDTRYLNTIEGNKSKNDNTFPNKKSKSDEKEIKR